MARAAGTIVPRGNKALPPLLDAAIGASGTLPHLATMAAMLSGWFEEHRRRFVWRETQHPYEVLIAEILLRKTTAPVVARFLPFFLERFPSPVELAAADFAQLTLALAPLGLSEQRAGQLLALAASLVAHYGSSVPQSLDSLLDLPGVGAYTAAMVASTCFGRAVPAVDTNVARVLCRVWAIAPTHLEARKSPNVWHAGGVFLQQWPGSPAEFNWALLDLGALVCTARQPRCETCPLRAGCVYARSADVSS